MPTIPQPSPDDVARWERDGLVPPGTYAAMFGSPLPGLPAADDEVSEKAFMAEVVALAKRHRWKVYHTHDSRRSQPGYPDLTLVKWGVRLIFAELKAETGQLTADQQDWVDCLRSVGEDVRIWRPSDWAEIEAVLRGEA